jgi:hypothetical protein
MNVHFSVAWNRKLPLPTSKYPMKATRKTVSCPFFKQLRMPFAARYMNSRFVSVLMISAEYCVTT